MVRRRILDGKPPTKYAPHAAHDEWRAGRRNIPRPMTSQALTISAHHTSSTVPTRLRQRHSLRDNEWRATASTCVAEVQRPFYSHHSTCRSIAPPPAKCSCCTLPPQAAHILLRSSGTAGIRANNTSPEGVSAHCDPLECAITGAPWRADYISLPAIPNPLVTGRIDHSHQQPRCEGALFARPTNRRTNTCG